MNIRLLILIAFLLAVDVVTMNVVCGTYSTQTTSLVCLILIKHTWQHDWLDVDVALSVATVQLPRLFSNNIVGCPGYDTGRWVRKNGQMVHQYRRTPAWKWYMECFVKDPATDTALAAQKAGATKAAAFTYKREHWTHRLNFIDRNLYNLLMLCCSQLRMLTLLQQQNATAEKLSKYGVFIPLDAALFQVTGVWLPRVLVSVLMGHMIADGGIESRQDSGAIFRLYMSSSPLSVDLVYFTAALLEMCGLGHGMVSWLHVWDPRFKQVYTSVRTNSISSAIFTTLESLWYVPGAGKRRKVLAAANLQGFDLIALAFVLLGDGFIYNKKLFIALYDFNQVELGMLYSVINSVTGTMPHSNTRVSRKSGDTQYRTVFTVADSAKLAQLLLQYFPNSGLYKLQGHIPEGYSVTPCSNVLDIMMAINVHWGTGGFRPLA